MVWPHWCAVMFWWACSGKPKMVTIHARIPEPLVFDYTKPPASKVDKADSASSRAKSSVSESSGVGRLLKGLKVRLLAHPRPRTHALHEKTNTWPWWYSGPPPLPPPGTRGKARTHIRVHMHMHSHAQTPPSTHISARKLDFASSSTPHLPPPPRPSPTPPTLTHNRQVSLVFPVLESPW